MSTKEYFQKAQADYEFYDVDEALEYAKEENLHDVMWVNSHNNQIYGGLYF